VKSAKVPGCGSVRADGEYFSGVGGWQGERKATGLPLVCLCFGSGLAREAGFATRLAANGKARRLRPPKKRRPSATWLASLRR
jgi:hypothetical protein